MESTNETSTRTIGNLSLIRKIAAGGMAEVWEARKEGVGGFSKRLAVKVILPHLTENDDFSRMFVDEGRLASLLEHPNICHIIDMGQDDGVYYMSMEYIDGVVLSALMKEAAKRGIYIPFEHCCQALIGACAGLDYAHSATDGEGAPLNLVHRDISPQNIMTTFDGNIKVVDFGIAKAASQMHHTSAGVLKGKYAYMSPEQATGDVLDRRSDVFALGVVLWEMTTGHRLFRADNEIATLHKIIGGDYESPSAYRDSYPPELELIVMKALAMDRDQRFQDCGEMQLALEDFLMRHGLAAGSKRFAYYVRWLLSDEEIPDLTSSAVSGVNYAFETSDPAIHTPSGVSGLPTGSVATFSSGSRSAPTVPMGSMSAEDFVDEAPGRRRRRRGSGLWLFLSLLLLCGAGVGGYFIYEATNQPSMAVLRPWVVNSNPRGADIFLNGDKAGTTRGTLYVQLGKSYSLRVVKKGHRPYHKFFKELKAKDVDKPLELSLQAVSKNVKHSFINVNVVPADAVAMVDGQKLTGRPLGNLTAFFSKVSADEKHTLVVKHPDFEEHNQSFVLKPDIQKVFSISLKKKKKKARRPRRRRTRPRRRRSRPRRVARIRRAAPVRNVLVIHPGKLRVMSSPPGAIVKLDGKIIGSTPMGGFVEVDQGRNHKVEIIKDGHMVHVQTIRLKSHQKLSLNPTLRPNKRNVALSYVSLASKPSSTIYINGNRIGSGSVFRKLPAGRYVVEFKLARYGVSYRKRLHFAAGAQRIFHRFKMGRLSTLSRPIARVYINGKFFNKTMHIPATVPAGRYKLRFVFPNKKIVFKSTTVRPGKMSRVKVKLH